MAARILTPPSAITTDRILGFAAASVLDLKFART